MNKLIFNTLKLFYNMNKLIFNTLKLSFEFRESIYYIQQNY